MKYNILIIVFCGLLYAACNNPKPNPSMDSSPMMTGFPASSNNSEIAIRELDSEVDTPDYPGVYEGILPSAGGEGMATNLTLFDDNRYLLQTMYIGKDNKIFEEHGRYVVVDGLLTLNPYSNSAPWYFRINDKYMTKLDDKQQEIAGEQAVNYRLIKK